MQASESPGRGFGWALAGLVAVALALRLPGALVSRIYERSRVARHFYDTSEIDTFVRRWSEDVAPRR